jgi:carbamoylphosphate synthase large subunit
MKKTLLVTSMGGTVGRIILEMIHEALPCNARIIVADCIANLSYLRDLAEPATLPSADDPRYATKLNSLIIQKNIDAILPLSEEECLIISELDEMDSLNGARYLGMPRDVLDVVTNKPRCAETLRKTGLSVPRCAPLTTLKTLDAALCQLGYPIMPVVLKPVFARGSRGFRIISATTDRPREMARKGGPIFIDLAQVHEIFKGREETLRDYFLMEYLPGDSLSIDIVAWKGLALGVFPHRRIGFKWGFIDQAQIFHDYTAEAYARAVVERLGLHGMCNIELGYAGDGELSLIEVNGRTSATAAQNRLVGANLFAILLRAHGGDLIPFKHSSQAAYRIYSRYSEGY